MNKIGICYSFWAKGPSMTYEEGVQIIKRTANVGFDVLELFADNLLEMSKQELDGLKKTADDKGVELVYLTTLPCELDVASADAATRHRGIEYVKRMLETIYYLGGKSFGGVNYTSWPLAAPKGVFDKRLFVERSIQSTREIAKTAEDFNIEYNVEVMNRWDGFILTNVQEGVEFVNAVGSPNVLLLLDTTHMCIEEISIEQAIRKAGKKLGHLHVCETNRDLPGKAHLPWNDIAKALSDIGYEGRLVIESFIKPDTEIGRGLNVWRDLSNNTDEEGIDRIAGESLEFLKMTLQQVKSLQYKSL
jgi:D-psicose/D-tagatose/L-ribulose 3-epimerase